MKPSPSYRLLAPLPLEVDFPSVLYLLEARFVEGPRVWRLMAYGPDAECVIFEAADEANLRRMIAEGFEVRHPSVAETIMRKLVKDGRADKLSKV